jgi:hypothetical protein
MWRAFASSGLASVSLRVTSSGGIAGPAGVLVAFAIR